MLETFAMHLVPSIHQRRLNLECSGCQIYRFNESAAVFYVNEEPYQGHSHLSIQMSEALIDLGTEQVQKLFHRTFSSTRRKGVSRNRSVLTGMHP